MTDDIATPSAAPFEVRPPREGSDVHPIVYDGIHIGSLCPEGADSADLRPAIVLNLGWAEAAGVRVLVQGNPAVDRKRGGIVLDR